MKTKFSDWLYWVLAFLPFAVTGAVYSALPERIPMHWDSAGHINRYGSRPELFLIPVAFLGAAALLWLLFRFADHSTAYKSTKLINASRFAAVIIFNIICCALLLAAYNSAYTKSTPDIYRVAAVLISLGDIVIANYLPKSGRNSLIGIRLKWTLANDEVWYKTHRFGGWLIAAGGVVCAILACILPGLLSLIAVFAGELIMLIILVVYSYFVYKKAGIGNE